MPITIKRTIDIEDAVRNILADHITCYCRPLPDNFTTPSVLVQQVGGTEKNDWSGDDTLDTFDIVLDARADTECNAWTLLRNAIGILKDAARKQNTVVSYVEVNSQGSWGTDPVRPDLALCSARLWVKARPETITIS